MTFAKFEDHHLMRLVAQQDADALSELYDRYGRLLFSVAIRLVGVAATAEEITFDTFHKAWQHADKYKGDRGTVRTWLAGMARNRAIDILRREGVRLDRQAINWDEMVFEPHAATPNPEKATERSLQKNRVHAAVAELPEAQSQVLALAYFKGMSHSEISKTLQLPLGTVKTRLRLGMKKLQFLLQEEVSDD